MRRGRLNLGRHSSKTASEITGARATCSSRGLAHLDVVSSLELLCRTREKTLDSLPVRYLGERRHSILEELEKNMCCGSTPRLPHYNRLSTIGSRPDHSRAVLCCASPRHQRRREIDLTLQVTDQVRGEVDGTCIARHG